MRKNNMFGIVIKEEWKLDKKKFFSMIGIVLVVNLVFIVLLATGYLKIRVTGVENTNASLVLDDVLPYIFMMEVLAILIYPAVIAAKHIKELLKDDSSFLYKMLPVNGFEIFGGKTVIALIELILLIIVVFVTSLVCATEFLMISKKLSSGLSQNFFNTLKMILDTIFSKDVLQFLSSAIPVPLIAAIFFTLCLAMFIAILRKSFSINLDSKLITLLGVILCTVLIIKIIDIKYNSIIFAVLTVGLFIANCVLYDRRVSV